nr:MAG TPA: HOLLIDAY JUNCTION RESOLVASE [Caudoviricetes sp.]
MNTVREVSFNSNFSYFMEIIAIDPSFTRTGVAILSNNALIGQTSFSVSEHSTYKITEGISYAHNVAKKIKPLLEQYPEAVVALEYPILATSSGSYLALITAKLDSLFRIKHTKVIYIPAVACNAYTGARTKTDIVNWVKERYQFKGDHDIATAVVLGNIGYDILNKKYKKSFTIVEY